MNDLKFTTAGDYMNDREELEELLQSYKESPSRGIKDEIVISQIEKILDTCEITYLRTEELPCQ